MSIHVVVWNENYHDRTNPKTMALYPNGLHGAIAGFLGQEKDYEVKIATMDMPEHGLTDDVLQWADVVVWWGHMKHHEVDDAVVEKVHKRVVNDGMGLVVLHSGHMSKIFMKLMGTGCYLKWREAGERERVWVINPAHPIAAGLPESFVIPEVEMYGEHFDIPAPDELVFISWYQGGEVFRSGCCFYRGRGKIFYFSSGHETFPIYYQPEVQQVIKNGVKWAAPANAPEIIRGKVEPLEKL